MIKGLAHYHEEYGGRNDRTALVWLVHNNPQEYLLQVISARVPGYPAQSAWLLLCLLAAIAPSCTFKLSLPSPQAGVDKPDDASGSRTAFDAIASLHSGDHPVNCVLMPLHCSAQVKFESKYCIACFWWGQQPETSFITHFLKTEKCNQFSLARNSTYNPLFLDHYRLSRSFLT